MIIREALVGIRVNYKKINASLNKNLDVFLRVATLSLASGWALCEKRNSLNSVLSVDKIINAMAGENNIVVNLNVDVFFF